MRILLVSDFFPPVRGGLEAHVDDLATELAWRGHEVHVATLTQNPTPSHAGVQTHVVRTTTSSVVRFQRNDRPFAPPLPDPGARRGLAQLVRSLRPDVVHAHSWLGVSLPRSDRPPTVFTAHDYAFVCQLHTLLRTSGERCRGPSLAACVRCGSRRYGLARSLALSAGTVGGRRAVSADRLLTLSQQVASVVGPYFDLPVEVITGFVREEAPAAAPAGLPPGPFVMYAGDPGDHKGFDTLLEVWAAGSAPRLPLVVASTKEVGRPVPRDVTVLQLDRAGVRTAWSRAALGVVPSRWDEPFGMVAIEALSAGVPVVASRVGALPELVRAGVDGLLVPPGDAEALRRAVDELLRDEPVRRRMAGAALTGSRRFAAAEVVPKLEAAYESTIAESRDAA